MKHGGQRGFTILETMLFLAITGLLFAGIMLTAGASIASQRYRDAVATLQLNLQQEYNETLNVSNVVRTDTGACGESEHRGQARCVILGRYIQLLSNGEMTSLPVMGLEPSGGVPAGDDMTALRSFDYSVDDSPLATRLNSTMEWGTTPSSPADFVDSSGLNPGGNHIYMLILRAPGTGRVYTFSRADTNTEAIPDNSQIQNTYLSSANDVSNIRQRERIICVEPQGLIGTTMAVSVRERASSATAVEMLSTELLEERSISC